MNKLSKLELSNYALNAFYLNKTSPLNLAKYVYRTHDIVQIGNDDSSSSETDA